MERVVRCVVMEKFDRVNNIAKSAYTDSLLYANAL